MMHDPSAIFRFEEHDIFIPMTVLEELDAGKKGLSEAARNVRQVSRFLDELMANADKAQIDRGLELPSAKYAPSGKRPPSGTAVLPDQAAAGRPAEHPARPRRRQRDPGADAGAAAAEPGGARHAGVEGHQPAHQGRDPRRARRGLLQRQDHRRRRPALHRRRTAAGQFLGQGRAQARVLARERRPHVLPGARQAGGQLGAEPVRLPGRRARARRHRALDRRRCGGDRGGARLPQRAARRLGHQRAQPRAELRAQPAARPGDRLRHHPRSGRHRQDAADAGRRPVADARDQSLHRDHHDARDDPAGRGHRLPARHRGGKDGALDGRADGQPRGADAEPGRRQLGSRRHQRPAAQPHQDPLAQLHARPHLPQPLPDPRRGAEPDAQADEGAGHARRPGHQAGVPRQHRADRLALPVGDHLRPHLRGQPLPRLEALRSHHADARRALAPGRLRLGEPCRRARGTPGAARLSERTA